MRGPGRGFVMLSPMRIDPVRPAALVLAAALAAACGMRAAKEDPVTPESAAPAAPALASTATLTATFAVG